MDDETERRWRAGAPPFDGIRVSTADLVPLPVLRRVLCVMTDVLQRQYPEPLLLTLHDWHEHDGYRTLPQPASWQWLRSLLLTDETLSAVGTRDTYVKTAVFPPGRQFYLRFDVLEEYEADPSVYPGKWGVFDVTCPAALAAQMRAAVEGAGAAGVTTEPAKHYFDLTYSG